MARKMRVHNVDMELGEPCYGRRNIELWNEARAAFIVFII